MVSEFYFKIKKVLSKQYNFDMKHF